MSRDYHINRPRGNLLPKASAPEESKRCMRFKMDLEHYNRTGEVIPLTEPEEFIPPEGINPFIDWVGNPETNDNEEVEIMPKDVIKPTKEQLAEDVKIMTNPQIAAKYGLGVSTVGKYIREYGLQRSNQVQDDAEAEDALLAIIAPREQEKVEPEPIINPSLEEREKFFTDTQQQESPKVEDPDEEKIWHNLELDIQLLYSRAIKRTRKEFKDRLLKLFECC